MMMLAGLKAVGKRGGVFDNEPASAGHVITVTFIDSEVDGSDDRKEALLWR
jgi:hypothetical protein